ncbi:MAG: hypothetical protein AAGJ35_14290 [Myxococcota bacterium]
MCEIWNVMRITFWVWMCVGVSYVDAGERDDTPSRLVVHEIRDTCQAQPVYSTM